MKIGRGYIPGDYWAICDRCGFEYRNSRLVTEQWTGLRVCRQCLDPKPVYPTQEPDRVAVPIPRPENDTLAFDKNYILTEIDINLFPDQNVLPANDGLWSAGINSQQHVKVEYYSKKLVGVDSDITVSGLEIGETYRLKASTWTSDASSILIDGNDSLIFATPQLETWFTDSVFFTASATSIVLTFVGSVLTNWYDDIYVQKYTVSDACLTDAEIISNKRPSNKTEDDSVDGTVINFFSFEEDEDFNAVGFDDGTLVDILE